MTLAKRIANWASNIFISGVVIVAALAFGRQTVLWWRADESGLNAHSAVEQMLGPGALAAEDASHFLEFGDFPYVFNRLVVRGDSSAALAGLRRYCGQAATRAESSDEATFPAEEKALARLTERQPVAEEPGRWQMYENAAPLPMVMVTTPGTIGTTPATAGDPVVEPTRKVAARKRRVLSWGLAFPQSRERVGVSSTWTLFVWSPGASTAVADVFHLSLPPGSKRMMTLRSEEGGAVIAFHGIGTLLAWRDHFDQWARLHHWRIASDWQALGGGWCVRWEGTDKVAVELQISAGKERELRGFATVIPPSPPQEK